MPNRTLIVCTSLLASTIAYADPTPKQYDQCQRSAASLNQLYQGMSGQTQILLEQMRDASDANAELSNKVKALTDELDALKKKTDTQPPEK